MGVSMRIKITTEMEVSLVDFDTAVDEIIREVQKKTQEIGQEILKALLVTYMEQITVKLCDENIAFPHLASGKKCEGNKGFRRRGKRERNLKTEMGEITVTLDQIECKECHKVFSPFLDVIGLKLWQRMQEGLKEKWINMATDISYRRSVKQALELTGVGVSKTQLNRWVLDDDWSSITFDVNIDELREIYADGTPIKKQDGTKEELRILLGRTLVGKTIPIGVWVGKSWEQIAKELIEEFGEEKFKGKTLLSDGETGIEKHLLFKDMHHQRCIWHAERDLGYMLWKDGLPKEARDSLTRQFKEIISIKSRSKLDEQEKEAIRERLHESKEALESLVSELKDRGLKTAGSYVERLSHSIFTYIELLLESGVDVSRTASPIERCMREIGRRIKKIGASWTDKGALHLIKFMWKRVFEEDNLRKYWREHLFLSGNCRITLHPVQAIVI